MADTVTLWEKHKTLLLQNIDEVIERGNTDKDTMVVMKEIITAAKLKKRTMTEYFGDHKEG